MVLYDLRPFVARMQSFVFHSGVVYMPCWQIDRHPSRKQLVQQLIEGLRVAQRSRKLRSKRINGTLKLNRCVSDERYSKS